MPNSAQAFYASKARECDGLRARLRKRSRWCVAGKLLTFLLFAYSVYLLCKHPCWLSVSAAVLTLALYLSLVLLDNRLVSRMETLGRKIRLCENELKALEGDFSAFRDGSRFTNPEHEYSHDLDLFGKASLFNRLNRTVTARGETALARMLTEIPLDPSEIALNKEAIEELKGMAEWRLSFLTEPFIENHSSDYRGEEGKRNVWLRSPLPYVSVGVALLLLLLALCRLLPWLPFILMLAFQLLLGMLFSKSLTRQASRASRLRSEYEGYNAILTRLHSQAFSSPRLRDIKARLFSDERNSLQAFRRLSRILNLIDQRSSVILYFVLNALCLYDLMLTRQLHSWGRRYAGLACGWVEQIAEFDALLSLSVYAFNHPENCPARLLEGSDIVVETKGIYHPFLPPAKAVPNDFLLKRRSIAIITGANMAGKSTFLRTVGVNYLLACRGVPVCAREFNFSLVSLFTSMRTTDNLSKDVSYFNAELLRLEQLIRHVKSKPFTLLILDEILKGTNSQDKVRGSTIFLQEIARLEVSAIVATHDLELAELRERQPSVYQNYRFEIDLADEIRYSYKITPGVARNMNASYLLSRLITELREQG